MVKTSTYNLTGEKPGVFRTLYDFLWADKPYYYQMGAVYALGLISFFGGIFIIAWGIDKGKTKHKTLLSQAYSRADLNKDGQVKDFELVSLARGLNVLGLEESLPTSSLVSRIEDVPISNLEKFLESNKINQK